MPEHFVPRESGRKLQVLEEGDPRGRPIFWLHGTPGCRLMFAPWVHDAREKGIRLIGYDRPGYGGSTALPGRNIAETGRDVGAIADYLGIERFGVWGVSGGGAPALACAATLPKRVVATVSMAGVAPFEAPGFDFFAGMNESAVSEYKMCVADRPAFEKLVRTECDQLAVVTAEQVRQEWGTVDSDADRTAVAGELGDFLALQAREGVKNGAEGVIEDYFAMVSPWGFELSSIRCPVQIWHGREDPGVPFQHGEWIAAHVPNAEAHLLNGEGHASLARYLPEVHAWLVQRF